MCVGGVGVCVGGGGGGGEITRLTCPPKGIAGASCTYALRERMRRGICLDRDAWDNNVFTNYKF